MPPPGADIGTLPAGNQEQMAAFASSSSFTPIEDAIAAIKAGKFVVVLDNEDRENEGDLIMPAACATPEALAFMIRYSSGVICAPTTAARLQELELPPMVQENTEAHRCAFTISVDLREGTSTGISASDRAKTIRAIGDTMVGPRAFNRPGHIFPLRAVEGGVLSRAGHTEAAVDLAKMAGFFPAGFLCELNNDDGTMMRRAELEQFAQKHDLPIITITDLIKHRLQTETVINRRPSPASVRSPFGEFLSHSFLSAVDGSTHRALTYGNIKAPEQEKAGVLVHIVDQSFEGLMRLEWAKKRIVDEGAGVIIFFEGKERLEEVSGKEMASVSIFGQCAQLVKSLGVGRIRALGWEPPINRLGFAVGVVSTETISL